MSTTVDSTLSLERPPSIISSTISPIWNATSAAETGAGAPARLALVPVTGPPRSRTIRRTRSWSGTRRATLSPPARARLRYDGDFRITMVSAPGQKRDASAFPSGVSSATRAASACSASRRGSGLSGGRPFTANSRRTAASSPAAAPIPYTVSVGKQTSPPSLRTCTANWRTSGSAAEIICATASRPIAG